MHAYLKTFLLAISFTAFICAGAFFVAQEWQPSSEPSSGSTRQLSIGWIGPLTGNAAPYGQAIRNGMELALLEAQHSIPRKPERIQVFYEDDQAQPRLGRIIFKSLRQRVSIPLIVQAAGSSGILVNIPQSESNKIIYISPLCSGDSIKRGGHSIFTTWPSAFSEEYRKRFDSDPDIYSAAGYDCMRAILEALSRTTSYEADHIDTALYSIKNFEGVTGIVSIGIRGEVRLPYESNSVQGYPIHSSISSAGK